MTIHTHTETSQSSLANPPRMFSSIFLAVNGSVELKGVVRGK